jgi:Domain of unknown function (DUF6378)
MNDAQVRENVLDEAKKCVLHDRNSTYGKPEDNFRRIAELWTAYLSIRPKDVGAPITPTDVAQMMLLMKVARLAHNPAHKDSWVDGIGYLACGAGIELGEDPRQQFQEAVGPTGVTTMMYSGPGLRGKGHIIADVEAAIKHIAGQETYVPKRFSKEELRQRLSGIKHFVKDDTGYKEISLEEAIDRSYNKQPHIAACQTQPTQAPPTQSSSSVSPS